MKNKIIPTQHYLLVQVRYEKPEGKVILLPGQSTPDTGGLMPYGYVVAAGPNAVKEGSKSERVLYKEGDLVAFLPDNQVVTFDDGYSIIPASAVFATFVLDNPDQKIVTEHCQDCDARPGMPHENTCPQLLTTQPTCANENCGAPVSTEGEFCASCLEYIRDNGGEPRNLPPAA